jgi:nucleoid DNA-binding protein
MTKSELIEKLATNFPHIQVKDVEASVKEIDENSIFQVIHVKDDHELLKFLKDKGIKINDTIKILKQFPTLSQMEIKHNDFSHVLSYKTSQMIYGKILALKQ